MRATGKLTLNHVLAHRVEHDGAQTAMVWESIDGRWIELSYGELGEQVGRLAAGLHARGVGPGDRVVVHMTNRPEFVIAMFAISRLGAVTLPTIASYAADELSYVLEHSEARLVLCDPGRLATVKAALDSLSGVAPPVVVSSDFPTEPDADAPPVADLASEAPAVLMYSSGTTARPKGVVLSHEALVLSGELNAQHQRLRPEDRPLCVLPLFHINAMTISLMASLVTGCALVLTEQFDANRYWSQVRTYGVTVGSLVANPIHQLLNLPAQPTDSTNHLRVMLFGMPLHPEAIATFEKRYQVPLINMWGMTEDGTIGTRSPPYLPRRPQSIGLPMAGVDLRVFDSEDHEVAVGEPGEARFHGGPRMAEYYRDPESTAASDRGGRFCTGDTMYVDELGFFHFLDRTKDVIKVKGENVASAEVERVLAGHPSVADVAVVGAPDPIRDERIVAFVVPAQGAPIDVEELRAHCLRMLTRFKVPHEVHVLDDFPRTSIGKVRKNELRAKMRS